MASRHMDESSGHRSIKATQGNLAGFKRVTRIPQDSQVERISNSLVGSIAFHSIADLTSS